MSAPGTPGPWSVEVEADCDSEQADIYVCHAGTVCDVTVVCTIGQSAYVSPDQKLADAHLIAAAPDLYEAVEAFVAYDEGHDDGPNAGVQMMIDYDHALTLARAALAKARGN